MLQDHQWFGKQADDLDFLAFLHHIFWLSHSLGSWVDWGCKSNFLENVKNTWHLKICQRTVQISTTHSLSTPFGSFWDQIINPQSYNHQTSTFTIFPHDIPPTKTTQLFDNDKDSQTTNHIDFSPGALGDLQRTRDAVGSRHRPRRSLGATDVSDRITPLALVCRAIGNTEFHEISENRMLKDVK